MEERLEKELKIILRIGLRNILRVRAWEKFLRIISYGCLLLCFYSGRHQSLLSDSVQLVSSVLQLLSIVIAVLFIV